MHRHITFWLLGSLAALFASGCIGMGLSPGFSCMDTEMFDGPPVVVKRGQSYSLKWKQGSYPFYFYPEHKTRDGALLFAMSVTTSTGNAAGRDFENPIKGKVSIEALQAGGAFWWEPDQSKVRLEIIEEKTAEPGATDNPDGA